MIFVGQPDRSDQSKRSDQKGKHHTDNSLKEDECVDTVGFSSALLRFDFGLLEHPINAIRSELVKLLKLRDGKGWRIRLVMLKRNFAIRRFSA